MTQPNYAMQNQDFGNMNPIDTLLRILRGEDEEENRQAPLLWDTPTSNISPAYRLGQLGPSINPYSMVAPKSSNPIKSDINVRGPNGTSISYSISGPATEMGIQYMTHMRGTMESLLGHYMGDSKGYASKSNYSKSNSYKGGVKSGGYSGKGFGSSYGAKSGYSGGKSGYSGARGK
jgi:hypothetical protein